jgi:hypothetical protein
MATLCAIVIAFAAILSEFLTILPHITAILIDLTLGAIASCFFATGIAHITTALVRPGATFILIALPTVLIELTLIPAQITAILIDGTLIPLHRTVACRRCCARGRGARSGCGSRLGENRCRQGSQQGGENESLFHFANSLKG